MLRKFNKMFKKSVKIYIDVFFVQWYNRCVYFNMEDNLGVYIMQKQTVKNNTVCFAVVFTAAYRRRNGD